MKRREVLVAAGAWGALAAARAQAQAKQPRIIGWLFPITKEVQKDVLRDFSSDLALLGHVEGRDYVIEGRWTGGGVEPLPAFARELVALGPALIVTGGTAAITALKAASSTVPVVFLSVGDPVASGFVASLARPGRNITGVMLRQELNGKLFDLMREILPALRRVAFLGHDGDPATERIFPRIQRAAGVLRYELLAVRVSRIEGLDRAFAEAVSGKCGAVIVPQLSLFLNHAQRIGALSVKSKMPLFSTWRAFAAAGGLLSYYTSARVMISRGAALVDKILRGASPAELAVEQPDRYTLVVNKVTAKALGINFPQSVLLQASEVLE